MKLCECGCGEPAPLATETKRRYGHVKGQPMRFRNGHNLRTPEIKALARTPERRALSAEVCRRRVGSLNPMWGRKSPNRGLRGADTAGWKGTPEDRFFKQVGDPDENGCIPWLGRPGSHGYGQLNVGRTVTVAHRFAYRLAGMEIPEGYQLHHECENKLCVNPNHLRPMTKAEHSRLHKAGERVAA